MEKVYIGVDFQTRDLKGANFINANLTGANFRGANLRYANLSDANLNGANLINTNFRGANLTGANLINTNFSEAKNVPYIPMSCPEEGEFIAYKKCRRDEIVKLKIPKDAKRSSATGRKCRCDKAEVISITDKTGKEIDKAYSQYDCCFTYEVGKTVSVPNFCEDRFNECAEGIHFFINRQEAIDY